MSPVLNLCIETDRSHSAAGRRVEHLFGVGSFEDRIDAVGENRFSICRAAGLQATDGARQGERAGINLRIVGGGIGINRRVGNDLAVVDPHHIEPAIFRSGADDSRRHAVDLNRENLGCVPIDWSL